MLGGWKRGREREREVVVRGRWVYVKEREWGGRDKELGV